MTPDELEKKIKKEYALAYGEIKNATKDYFDKLKDRISVQQLRLERGEITQDYYNQWLLNQAGRGERWKDMQQKISDRLVEARKTAVAYTNDTTPGVYTLNRNYSAYQIDTGTGPQEGTAWTAWDESTLKRLQTEDRQLVPLARTVLNINKAEKWNKQHIQSALTSAILQGKSVGQLADSFEALALMDRNSSLRNARTALTGAQNAGRQEAYREADEMGITIKKEWICTQDSRTRDSHIELDGQIVDYDEPFKTSNGHEIMYPGDPTAEPCEVWNCRCTMRAILPKHKINQERVTYDDWVVDHSKVYKKDDIADSVELEYTEEEKKIKYTLTDDERTKFIKTFSHPDDPVDIKFPEEDIINDLLTTETGYNAIQQIIQDNVKILVYDDPRPDDYKKYRGSYENKVITLFAQNNNDLDEMARTIIHEQTHHKYKIGPSQRAECICVAYEVMHKHDRNYVTSAEWNRIVESVKNEYGEDPWEKKGDKYEWFEKYIIKENEE